MTNKPRLRSDDLTRYSIFNLNYKIIFKVNSNHSLNHRVSYLFKQSAKRLSLAYQVHLTGWTWSSQIIEMRIHSQSMLKIKQFADKFKQISSSDYHYVLNPQYHQSIWKPGYCLITVSSHSRQTIHHYLAK